MSSLETQLNIPKEHWARIKALSRYIGYLGKDDLARDLLIVQRSTDWQAFAA